MDAKLKANFINSVASGQKKPCPICYALNEINVATCFSCGYEFEDQKNRNPASDFSEKKVWVMESQPVQEKSIQPTPEQTSSAQNQPIQGTPTKAAPPQPAFESASQMNVIEEEEKNPLAQGLPAWDVVPPQVMVRRKKKR